MKEGALNQSEIQALYPRAWESLVRTLAALADFNLYNYSTGKKTRIVIGNYIFGIADDGRLVAHCKRKFRSNDGGRPLPVYAWNGAAWKQISEEECQRIMVSVTKFNDQQMIEGLHSNDFDENDLTMDEAKILYPGAIQAYFAKSFREGKVLFTSRESNGGKLMMCRISVDDDGLLEIVPFLFSTGPMGLDDTLLREVWDGEKWNDVYGKLPQ
jgi:hypothetical protein